MTSSSSPTSNALKNWRTVVGTVLEELHRRCNPSLPFCDQDLQSLTLTLSAYFQKFFDDVYAELTKAIVAKLTRTAKKATLLLQLVFSAASPIDGNPKTKWINDLFEMLDMPYHVGSRGDDPEVNRWQTDLGHLIYWRNRCAHGITGPVADGLPRQLDAALLRKWITACDNLAVWIDSCLREGFQAKFRGVPWQP